MTENSSLSYNRIEALNDKNYHVWALKVSAVLRARRLYKQVIENEEPPISRQPESVEAKAREQWEIKNDEAFGIIITTLSDDQAGQFLTESRAKVIWNELKRMHAGKTEDRRIDLAVELRNLKMTGNESVIDYITRAKNIASKSASIGFSFEEREVVYHVVRGIHSKFEKVATVLRTQRSIELSEVQQALEEEEQKIALDASNGEHQTSVNWKNEKALKAFTYRKKETNRSQCCYICGRNNHIAKACFYKNNKNNEVRQKQTNFNTGNRYHRKYREQASVAIRKEDEYCLCTWIERPAKEKVGNERSAACDWALDSGSTSHMTPNRNILQEAKPYRTTIGLAKSNRSIDTEAIGKVKVTTMTAEGMRNLCINNVLYVPSLRNNLLSVSQLIESGNRVIFNNKGAKIIGKMNTVLGEAEEKDGMYILETKLKNGNNLSMQVEEEIPEQEETLNQGCRMTEKDKTLWHKRLGHICEEYLNIMKRNNIIRDLKYTTQNIGKCEACILGKFAQDPYRSIEGEKTNDLLELVHIDVCGPMPIESMGGSKYILVLVDDYSKYTCVYFMKHKDQVFEYFTEYVNRYENQLSKNLKKIRTDNGTEFINKKFEEFTKEKGILHQRTVPYSPQSNGIVERMNRTLMDKARALLADAELTMNFWAEAVSTAAYLKNMSISKGRKEVTPKELWTGKKPTASYLKIFGCIMYYYVPKPLRNKLDNRTTKGIFVGYSENSRAYRVFDPFKKKMHAVRSGKFDENAKGSSLLKEKNGNTEDSINKFSSLVNKTIPMFDEEIIQESGEDTEIEYTTTEADNTLQNNLDGQQQPENRAPKEPNKTGRKPGVTNEEIKKKHQEQMRRREEQFQEEGVRRSKRIKDQRHCVNIANHTRIPQNYAEASCIAENARWRKAMEREIDSMKKHEVWELVPRPKNAKVIKSKWIYNMKDRLVTDTERYKARLVAVGCSQQEGIDYEESFSPVIKLESFRTLMAIASVKNLCIRQFDVKTAYLYAKLQKPVYMEQPEGFTTGGKDLVCRLNKSIYGLPQSGRQWNDEFNKILNSMGFKNIPEDPCVYHMRKEDKIIIIGIYVDDCIFLGSDEEVIESVINQLRKKIDIKEIKEELRFLNIEIRRSDEGISLSQRKYIEQILEKYSMGNCNRANTPMSYQQTLDEYKDSLPVEQTVYQEMLGNLMYLAVSTRPDIAFIVSYLSRFSQDSRKLHLEALKRVYRYIKGTKEYVLKYERDGLDISALSDASWNVTLDAKSYSGYIVKLGNSVVSWKSQKQNIVALSTCEAELIAICEATKELTWISQLLDSLDIINLDNKPMKVQTDSMSAIEWIKKNNVTSRTKHINRKFYFVRDAWRNGSISLEHVNTAYLEADALTKGLPTEKHLYCLNKMLKLC